MKDSSRAVEAGLRISRWSIILPVATVVATGLIIMYGQLEGAMSSRTEAKAYIKSLLKERRSTTMAIDKLTSARILSLEERISALEQVHLQCVIRSK